MSNSGEFKECSYQAYFIALGQVKKNNWLASFFQKFYGREGGFYFYFFDSEVLIGRNTSKTHPYLLLFLHPSVQAFYIIHKHHNGTQKT